MGHRASLNHVYRLVWSRVLNTWVAVAETARGTGKGSGRCRPSIRGLLLLVPFSLFSTLALSAPSGGQVAAGSGSISQSGSTTTINQSSEKLSLSWKTFNVGASETVNFRQPNSSALAVNRIHDTNGSTILGNINANGQVYLINPNGILFGKGAQVNVGGLIASTLDTADGTTFSGNGKASVVNEGTINASQYVALLGNSVTNSGVITAQMGTVALGAGNDVSLTFSGNNLVKLQVNKSVVDALVANHGLIKADGGRVMMNAGARDTLLASVVNNDGIVQAQTVQNRSGTITLLGGMKGGAVNVGGTLDASAPTGGSGGHIETSAAHVHVASDAKITTKAANGSSGSWLIDPVDFTIASSGGDMTGTTLSNNLGGGSVTIQSTSGSTGTAGNINVNDAVSWSANTLTLNAQNNININSTMNATGTAGLALQYGQASSNGGSSAYNVNAPVNLAATSTFTTQKGTNSANAITWTIVDSLGVAADATTAPSTMTLQGMATGLTGHYVLGADIDASVTSTWNTNQGFTPISRVVRFSFSGSFDGLGHTITNLTIKRPNAPYIGLFGVVSGAVRNVGLVGGTVVGSARVGELAGLNNGGTISNAYATGNISGAAYLGGLVGSNLGGTISNAYATGSVSGSSINVGGLVGYSYSGGRITGAYATGSVSGGTNVGGLVGWNRVGTISNGYATGSVSGGSNVGGLVGVNSSTISNAYVTGSVSGGSNVGGLVGVNHSTISNGYWDTTTGLASGIGANSGLVTGGGGLTTTALSSNLPTGFSSSIWANAGNQTTPYLLAHAGFGTVSGHVILGTDTSVTPTYYGVIQNLTQLQDINSTGLAGKYVLGTNIDASATSGWNSNKGFAPIGNSNTPFTGTFDGLGHTISNLYITRANKSGVGLFGGLGPNGVVRNIGMLGGSVTGNYFVGELLGSNAGGTISNAYATGNVSGTQGVGGLVGSNSRGTISNAYATGSISGTDSVGGLVGGNAGHINNAYATGNVSGTQIVGGLVGSNSNGSISNAYATGRVSGTNDIGGLVGLDTSNATVTSAYATGSVSGGSYVGGLIGNLNGGKVTDSYWDTTTGMTSGFGQIIGTVTGGGGLTTKALSSNLPAGFSSSVWANGGNQTTPYLLANASFSAVSGHVILGTDTASSPAYYGVIQNLTQLQNISSTGLAGHYVLGQNIDASATSTWNSGAGFAPIGDHTTTFTGVLDGLGHTITNLTIKRPTTPYIGLFGALSGAVRNVGLVGGSITGSNSVGGLVGWNSIGTITNAYFTGSVSGSDNVGGLVGSNDSGTVSNAYATGSVSGVIVVGGLVGFVSTGTVSNAYATGSVSGVNGVGGLLGCLDGGTLSNAYATGSVSGSNAVGGLVGSNGGAVTNGYWDTTTSGTATGIGTFYTGATITGGGLTDSQMKQSSNFTGFDFTNTWVQYNGHTDPLLRTFMTPLTVTGNAVSKTYDGAAYSGGLSSPTYSVAGAASSGHLYNQTTPYGSSAINAGSYTSDLYSDQQGYIITQNGVGALTINKAPLTVTAGGASKTYDGSAWSGNNGVNYSGFVNGETASVLGGSLSYGGSAQGAVNAGSYAITPSGLTSGNYAISYVDGTLTVNKAPLTVTANGYSKTYDGTPYSGGNGVNYSGFVNGEGLSVLGGSLAYGGSAQGAVNAGSYAITPGGYTSGNYAISYVDGTLTITQVSPSMDDINATTYALSLLHHPQPDQPGGANASPQASGNDPAPGHRDGSESGGEATPQTVTIHLGSSGGLNIVNEGVRLPADSL